MFRLRELAALDDAVELGRLLYAADTKRMLTDLIAEFERHGDQAMSASHWREAIVSFRVARYALLAVDYHNSRVRTKLTEAEMGLFDELAAGPMPDEGLALVEWLAMNGQFAGAADLFRRLMRTAHGDHGIRTSSRFEQIGDHLAHRSPECAPWFYACSSELFRDWVASSSSGGEGIARSEEEDTAAAKLAKLGSFGDGP